MRDPTKGKDLVIEEETTVEVPVEQVEFRPTTGSSGHRPITWGDFEAFVGEELLARLL